MRWALAARRTDPRAAALLPADRRGARGKCALAAGCRRRARRSREGQPRSGIRRPRRDHVRAPARSGAPLARRAASKRYPTPEEGSCPSCCSMPLAAVAHPSGCRSFAPAGRRAIRGFRYPADPPTVEEIIAVMRAAGDAVHGRRLRGLIVVLWRAGLRICEALALTEADLDSRRGSLLVRRGKGGRRREVGMDDWAWKQLEPRLKARVELPIGPLF